MSKELEALELIKLDYGVEPQGYELIKSALEQNEKLKRYIAKLIEEDNKKCRTISKLCDKLCQLENENKDLIVNINRCENHISCLENQDKKLEKAFDTLSKEGEKAKKLLSLEIEKNRAFEIIKENLNIDEILFAIKGVCKASDYDLVKEMLK